MLTWNAFVSDVYNIASINHQNQTRKDKVTLYINHPLDVAFRIYNFAQVNQWYYQDISFRTALALAHDTLEYIRLFENETHEMATDRLMSNYSDVCKKHNMYYDKFIAVLLLLTKDDTIKYDDYLLKIKANEDARIVKTFDMISNLSDNPSPKQIVKYSKGLSILNQI